MKKIICALMILLFSFQWAIAAELIVLVEDIDFTLPTIRVETKLRPKATNQFVNHTFTATNSVVTSANFVSSMKTLLIAAALSRFGVTLVATDILIIGAPQ